jgi:hypothetical protein
VSSRIYKTYIIKEAPMTKDFKYEGPSFIQVIKRWGPLLLLIPAFYFYGQFREESAVNWALIEKGSLTSERDRAQTMSEFSKLSLEQQVDKNIALEMENRELRDKINIIGESLSTSQHELQNKWERITELPVFGAAEIFNNQFLIALYSIYEDTSGNTIPSNKITANVALRYIGMDRTKLEKQNTGDYFEGYDSQLFLGDTMDIEYNRQIYVIRLLSIDPQNKKATFSHYVKDK